MGGETVYIGFGSNLGDRQEFCERTIMLMGLLPQSRLVAASSYYETQPVDPEGILGSLWFYNGVVKIETLLAPIQLWKICRETERALGREEEHRSGPRTIDLDLLFYGQRMIHESSLIIPHPRLHLRRFVLEPLVELDPNWNHPTFNQTVEELLRHSADESQVRKLDLPLGSRFLTQPVCSSRNPL
jgi:2-amino-4-hydroxy-6-hydroxymethyldihydropteridine diphosphokinase